MNKATKTSFREATKFIKIFNNIVEWNGFTLAMVAFHGDREWKHIKNGDDFDTIAEREYKPIAEFHTQEELWQYLKQLMSVTA